MLRRGSGPFPVFLFYRAIVSYFPRVIPLFYKKTPAGRQEHGRSSSRRQDSRCGPGSGNDSAAIVFRQSELSPGYRGPPQPCRHRRPPFAKETDAFRLSGLPYETEREPQASVTANPSAWRRNHRAEGFLYAASEGRIRLGPVISAGIWCSPAACCSGWHLWVWIPWNRSIGPRCICRILPCSAICTWIPARTGR